MTFEIKSTNLLLLRHLLEGKYDDVLDVSNGNMIITNDSAELLTKSFKNTNDGMSITNKNKILRTKKCKRRKRNLEFYLDRKSVITRDWLKEKKILSDKKKKDLKRQQKEDDLRALEEVNKNMEREAMARESYNRWLKDTRNAPRSNSHATVQGADIYQKRNSTEALESFNLWLMKKEKAKQNATKKTVTKDLTNQQVNNTKLIFPVCLDTPIKPQRTRVSSRKDKVEDNKANKVLPQVDEIEENMNHIVTNMRRERLKDKERSKVRVDSGVFFKRESQKKTQIKPQDDRFLWRFVTNDDKEEEEDNSKIVESDMAGNSRSRQIQRISHEHSNPFAVRTADLITTQ